MILYVDGLIAVNSTNDYLVISLPLPSSEVGYSAVCQLKYYQTDLDIGLLSPLEGRDLVQWYRGSLLATCVDCLAHYFLLMVVPLFSFSSPGLSGICVSRTVTLFCDSTINISSRTSSGVPCSFSSKDSRPATSAWLQLLFQSPP